jgi:phosphoribosyl-ATP pyrophosphohydrolase
MDSVLHEVDGVIRERRLAPRPGSYTTSLLAGGIDGIARKVGEEAIEVILAAKGEGAERLVEESADLIYHLLVLLAANDLGLADIEAELRKRR